VLWCVNIRNGGVGGVNWSSLCTFCDAVFVAMVANSEVCFLKCVFFQNIVDKIWRSRERKVSAAHALNSCGIMTKLTRGPELESSPAVNQGPALLAQCSLSEEINRSFHQFFCSSDISAQIPMSLRNSVGMRVSKNVTTCNDSWGIDRRYAGRLSGTG
jgi:hypothetical protein